MRRLVRPGPLRRNRRHWPGSGPNWRANKRRWPGSKPNCRANRGSGAATGPIAERTRGPGPAEAAVADPAAEGAAQLDQHRDQLAAEAAKLETCRGELETQRSGLAQQRSALEDERCQWESRQAESVAVEPPQDSPPAAQADSVLPPCGEVEFQPPSEKAPVDLADVFRRVGAKVEMPEYRPTGQRAPVGPVPSRCGASAAGGSDCATAPCARGAGGCQAEWRGRGGVGQRLHEPADATHPLDG